MYGKISSGMNQDVKTYVYGYEIEIKYFIAAAETCFFSRIITIIFGTCERRRRQNLLKLVSYVVYSL